MIKKLIKFLTHLLGTLQNAKIYYTIMFGNFRIQSGSSYY